MAETKYGKYIISTKPKTGEKQEGLPDIVARTDGNMLEGSNHFLAHRISPWFVPPPHGPHIHMTPEILVMLGTDPNDPWDLGGEVHLCMGKEMEKHIITTSTLVYIPPGLVHCPIVYKRVDRPFIFVYSVPVNKLQETPCEYLIPENERNGMIFLRH